MQDDIVVLIVGFVLTTVLGGVLGHYFQSRSWQHQNDARLREAERAAAKAVFEELSTLMDKRLYRMRQLDAALTDGASSAGELDRHLELYRDIRYAWNDSLNRNLALTHCYFGEAVRGYLESHVYEGFRERHFELIQNLTARRKRSDVVLTTLEPALKQLSDRIYSLNVMMADLVRDDHVGRSNPDVRRAA